MYLKPVSVSTQRRPYCSAIAFCRSVVTKVLMMTPRECVLLIQHALLEERLRPILGDQRPDLVAGEQFHFSVAIAHRDAHSVASGSVAITRSAFPFSASSIAESQRLGIFRVWRFHRRKIVHRIDPVPARLRIETEPLEHRLDDDAAGSVDRGVDDAQDFASRTSRGSRTSVSRRCM